jgi:Zn-dependent protease with chaperone function
VMLPGTHVILLFLFIGGAIHLVGAAAGRLHRKFGYAVEIAAAIVAVGYSFYQYSFPDGFIYIGFISSGYFSMIMLTTGREKYDELRAELSTIQVEEIELQKGWPRVLIDFVVVAVVFSGAILFYLYGPVSPLDYIIVFGVVSAMTELAKRFFAYKTVKVYYSDADETIYILSKLEARKFPISEVEQLQIESTVDLLRLHPLFTLFTSHTDFTTSFYRVLRISVPGETLYLTVKEPEKWKERFAVGHVYEKEVRKVLPFYHKKNLKRLLGKLYFAATVKGVSAYTGLLLILYALKVPVWLIVAAGLFYWVINLYFSDKVLRVAMDARETADPRVITISERVFAKAGIPNVKVYETESSEYNGLATGMNIGRSMVTLTTATLKLPAEAIEGILAHEAIHVKKRDVMWGQVWRFGFLVIVIAFVLWIVENLDDIEAYKIPFFIMMWLLMILFPVFQSFCSQWMEVRADHLGATMLEGGHLQMAESLTVLAKQQDAALNKSLKYSTVAKEKAKEISSLKRDSVFLRLIEFQFMPHPPMYWRVKMLREHPEGWGKAILRRWLVDRIRESVMR